MPSATSGTSAPAPTAGAGDDDQRAVERYRYLLRTAPPDQIEQAHAEAFEAMTPTQRRQVLQALSEHTPPGERTTSDDPRSLARMATRAEMRHPGTLERSFRRGPGMGTLIGGSLLASVAGAFIGSAIAHELFGPEPGMEADSATGADDETRYGNEEGADPGEGDYGGDYGGDFGGGDFGGGDFGGGDFGGF